ncbi:hypothetical protein COO91_08352 [Nostoc flagelliforme CCNUN1]|uniref:Uncharacterized protein n=1 Tax=Nostoc flagelliforme CCNUN1 TaxID=2038116 RepID=A0A2K8T3P5_9NOSO|nr:hypothetical protein COO91_08352 [Nostoc flagelliforme CCNUN1]
MPFHPDSSLLFPATQDLRVRELARYHWLDPYLIKPNSIT